MAVKRRMRGLSEIHRCNEKEESMKHRTFKILAVLLVLMMGSGTIAFAENDTDTVSFRIEGMENSLYSNSMMTVSFTESGTLIDVIDSYNSILGVPKITITHDAESVRITQIGQLGEKTVGGSFNDGWLVRVNNAAVENGLDTTMINAGDNIVIYYGDPASMQYPEVDLSRMISDGIVKLTSDDRSSEGQNVTTNPVAHATVIWDGMTYTSDDNGEFIIDSTGAGVRHTLHIQRYNDSGLPTVLRTAPNYYVKYGFEDVAQDDWYYDAVMFVSERYLLSGISETDFGPRASTNRAMFVTLLGRLAGADVDQTVKTSFTDVINDGWSTGYIAWASQNGLVTGYPDGTFGQYKNITREQIAILFYRYATFKGYDTALVNSDLTVYTDYADVSDYADAQTAVKWAVEKGIIKGIDDRLDPQGLATRAQVATLLERFIHTYGG